MRNSYRDSVEGHVLYKFNPMVEPEFKIIKNSHIIYLPIYSQGLLYGINIKL